MFCIFNHLRFRLRVNIQNHSGFCYYLQNKGLLKSPAEFLKSLQYFHLNLSFSPNSGFVSLLETTEQKSLCFRPYVLIIVVFKYPKVLYSFWFWATPGTRAKHKKLKGPSLVGTFSSKLQCISTTLMGTLVSSLPGFPQRRAWYRDSCAFDSLKDTLRRNGVREQDTAEEELSKNLLLARVRLQPCRQGAWTAPQCCSHLEETYKARQLLLQPMEILWRKGQLWAFSRQHHSSWGMRALGQ